MKPPTTFDRGQWLVHSKGFWAAALGKAGKWYHLLLYGWLRERAR